MALAAFLGAVTLIQGSVALVRTAFLNIFGTCGTLPTCSTHACSVILTLSMVAAVALAKRFLTTFASETLITGANAVRASSTIVAILWLARHLVTNRPSPARHAFA